MASPSTATASFAAFAPLMPDTCCSSGFLRIGAHDRSPSSYCPRPSTTAGERGRSATRPRRFNPMSYHNGTVWPHDTSLCAAGMARYGHRAAARHLLQQSFAAATHFGMRLPELLCGFSRRIGEPPVGYPVACLPQAWSSGAVFLMLQATLGVQLDAGRREILIDRPELPHDVEHLDITGLEINDEKVDLHFRRRAGKVVVQTTLSRPGSVRVSVTS